MVAGRDTISLNWFLRRAEGRFRPASAKGARGMEGSTALASDPSGSEVIESAVVRFAGDSGDGMPLTGSQFPLATALAGNHLAPLPAFPAAIPPRATPPSGVSPSPIHF